MLHAGYNIGCLRPKCGSASVTSVLGTFFQIAWPHQQARVLHVEEANVIISFGLLVFKDELPTCLEDASLPSILEQIPILLEVSNTTHGDVCCVA